jgi:two-component system response regulator YcbB
MRFYITDDDQAVRFMLKHIIEDADLGEVVGEADDGAKVDADILALQKVDILLIDLLMPDRDGIETVRQLGNKVDCKIIMISQIESKEMIAEAYSLGIEYYITKPINRLEVIRVIQKVSERILLEKSIEEIRKSLSALPLGKRREKTEALDTVKSIITSGKFLLTELGVTGESGSRDLLDMLEYIYHWEKENPYDHQVPPLKEIFYNVAVKKLGPHASSADVQKEVKAAEQRVRRAVYQALTHLASLGLTDYSNPKFETYATNFFEFTEVRKKMRELEEHVESNPSSTRINTKKFVLVLYQEAKRLAGKDK